MPLEPQIAAVLDMINAQGTGGLSAGTPEQARAGFRFMTVDLRDPSTMAPVRSVEQVVLPGPAGQLPARVYRPELDGLLPTIVFFHGGGFVIGDLDTHEDHARLLAAEVGAVVLSVEYRLAPEHPFPAAYEDCLAATVWAGEHVDELGGDAARIAVAGDSAGGNLAATIAMEFDPVLALLIYPVVDATVERRSRQLFGKGFFLTDELMEWYTGHFMPEGSDPADPLISPLLSPRLSESAPALVVTAGFDPLRDEGEAYAEALREAGVPVLLRRFPGLFHGFINSIGASPSSYDALVEVAGMTRALLRAA
jgi:acetyl esterase